MANVVVCYKWVIDEADVRVKDDLSVDFSRAKMKISDYDRNAIEAGVQVAASLGGKALGLTYNDDRAAKSVKDALSRGLDELVWVNDPAASQADAARTASALAESVKGMEDVSMVLCSEGSSDQFARQTAPRIAAKLGWPVITCAQQVNVEGGVAHVARQLEDAVEQLDVQLPCVVSVLPTICDAPIPGLKQIMAAKKKPNAEKPVADLPEASAKSQVDGLRGYAMNRKNVLFDAADESAVAQLVDALKKEGVL